MSSYKATDITKSFGSVGVLHGIGFEVKPGTIHGLFGHNGAGKSTLLKILAGAQPQDNGTLSVDGETVTLASPREALGKGIGCVYQELRLIPNLTVAENLFLGREVTLHGLKKTAEMNAYCKTLLASYGLHVDVTRTVKGLSHPEKQLLEVIANLEGKVRYLFLDEPTTALDGNQSTELLAHVRRIALERNIGVVLVSHKLDEVLAVCDEATVLSGGRVVYHAAGQDVSKQAIVDAIVGDAHGKHVASRREARAAGEIFLKVEGLAGKRLKGADIVARRGEVLGLYGLIGSGRTRFLRTLYGMEPISAGTVEISGKRYTPSSPKLAIQHGIAFLTEERKQDGFIPLMSSFQNVVLSTLTRYRNNGIVDLNAARASAQKTLASIGTRGRLDAPTKSLSGGNQQKVLLGRIIEQDADLILLDEPTKGVDIGAKSDIYDIIRRLADEGRCIVVVSSEEEELVEICDRIAIFQHGFCTTAPKPVEEWSLGKLREAAWAPAA
ncbi:MULTISPECIES: sugar ABC transporter ATP-binding protein [unclassified Agrobacterium]|uniref:sugar ABC transporter ATP-binding protein n=1 Tax=unclassified Agrobacterium TaxID=2632611 RepID=UPI00244940D2|nr:MULTISPECIES: sugar ABC transporter ATP-binding protein [unclassified Agrobacterium]MDH0613798.1 sugar ABC transporter ATP-binding protein [Agrobacterium sp. GD03872]MDH0696687.1 sugar ABC transporter ATP-binding protein [Agrobacterium sp. GD03871]MDH1060149.1 sugar ABC transporter ATP-binding protein [Agrobacterium sp. GD03992]MDH2210062.1 sugar ABC transporter ATP-binding protein [Agrobacterium sp. GD03643]MDH2219561.1 sugar ABC transporter ATP-binding protein [Agrobacterium sp. GD03638]